MEFNQTLPVYNNSVIFGIYKFSCKEIHLISTGVQFFQVLPLEDFTFSSITIPPIDIQRAYFDGETCKTCNTLSTMILETVPSFSFAICEKLKIKSNHAGGTIRVAVQFNGKTEEIQKTLNEYFSMFNTVTWKLDKTLSISVHQYFDFLNNHFQQPTSSSMCASTSRSSSIPTPARLETAVTRTKSDSNTDYIEMKSDDEDAFESRCSSISNSNPLFCYPYIHTCERISVFQSDLACLEEGQYLNNTILDFYLKYIENELTSQDITERSYIFSTSFYQKLVQPQASVTTHGKQSLFDIYYNRVENWTKNINIFEKDFIIIPINESCHWFLAILCYPREVPLMNEILPNQIEKNLKRPCILFMDSLHSVCGSDAPIRNFLTQEWESKKKTKKDFSKHVMPAIHLKVPKQVNSFDCGLYVLQYIEHFLRDPHHLLRKINKDPTIDLGDWFSHLLVLSMRRRIKRLIKQKQKAEEIKKSGICETGDDDSD